jgi:septum formation protein
MPAGPHGGSSMDVVLASKSPRRTQLLDMLGIPHRAVPSGAAETALPEESPEAQVLRLAREKALAVARREPHAEVVVGADTLVVLGGKVLGQPADREEAVSMLRHLSGETHVVYTGVYLRGRGGREAEGLSESRVTFRPMTEEEIAWYVATGEPMDKAGAYAAQGAGAVFIRSIQGSFHNVVGFPVDLFYDLLPQVGLSLEDLRNDL